MFGGVLRDGEKVVDIQPGSVVSIQTNKGTYKAKNVVLTPGNIALIGLLSVLAAEDRMPHECTL